MQPDELTDILFSSERESCNELALVLASQAIESQVHWNGNRWVLSVPSGSVALARREIDAYAAESRARDFERARPPPTAAGSPWPGIWVYTVVLVGFALAAPEMGFGIDWLAAGRMDGGRLLAGEWWRPLTALTLHADAAHLLGNVFFGSFFAWSVARYLGGGFGWLLIVGTAAIANFANGVLSGPDHRSIGASTAVFAALGIVSAYCWRRGFRAGASRRERMAPVIAGIGLLAFTGTGGINTDLGAHLLGFVAGFGGGLVAARTGFPADRLVQLGCGAAAAGLITVAWLAAVA